jgi:hypothetical protein
MRACRTRTARWCSARLDRKRFPAFFPPASRSKLRPPRAMNTAGRLRYIATRRSGAVPVAIHALRRLAHPKRSFRTSWPIDPWSPSSRRLREAEMEDRRRQGVSNRTSIAATTKLRVEIVRRRSSPRPQSARTAYSRAPTPSRCNSCRSRRRRASCAACT